MKLGIINDWSENGFSYAAKKGLEFVEFCVNGNYNVDDFVAKADGIAELSKRYGVGVGSCGRWGIDRLDNNGIIATELENSYKLIDACQKMGCPVFVCGCNKVEGKTFEENCELAVEYFGKLVEYASSKDIKIAVYNCDWNNFVYDASTWDAILPKVDSLGIKYDISHCLSRGGDYLVEARDYGNKFYHIHIKGSLYIGGKYYDSPPAGLDQTNWGAFFDMLYSKSYNAGLSIEPHSEYWQGKKGQWGVDFTIKFIKQFMMPEDYGNQSESPYMP